MEKQYIKELFKLINKYSYAKMTVYEYRDSFPAAFEKATPELEAFIKGSSSAIYEIIDDCNIIKRELAGIKDPEPIPDENYLPPSTTTIKYNSARVLPLLEDLIWEGQQPTDLELTQGDFYSFTETEHNGKGLYDGYKESLSDSFKNQPEKAQAFDNVFNPAKIAFGGDNAFNPTKIAFGGDNNLYSAFETLYSSKDSYTDKASDNAKEDEKQNGGMKFCPYCGNKLTVPDAKFCPNCGNKIN